MANVHLYTRNRVWISTEAPSLMRSLRMPIQSVGMAKTQPSKYHILFLRNLTDVRANILFEDLKMIEV